MSLMAIWAALEVADFLKAIQTGGIVGVLVAIIVGGFRQWWVWGYQLKQAEEQTKKVEQERDDWRQLAFRAAGMTEQTINLFRESNK